MRVALLFALASLVAGSLQEVIDGLFDEYLPAEATWKEVKECHATCRQDSECMSHCPRYECPWKRISKHCDIFNATLNESMACHRACEHDVACHFKCPNSRPTSLKELHVLGEAIACHKSCGHHDRDCHMSCPKPWSQKQALCGRLEEVAICHRNHGWKNCPRLDNATKKELLEEPFSLVKDVADHVADYLLPLSSGQEASQEEVRTCHKRCGNDHACHKACSQGVWGILKDQCSNMKVSSKCHHACEQLEVLCPFAKMKCHFKCPISLPGSVKELKELADHVSCHIDCGKEKTCHDTCPNIWARKEAQCEDYDKVVACHKACGKSHSYHHCHTHCPRIEAEMLSEVAQEPRNMVKDAIKMLIV